MLECLETAGINFFESNERIEFLKIEALMSAEWMLSGDCMGTVINFFLGL